MNRELFEYSLRLGDTSLILGHRLSEWCGHGPILEEDIAMANLSLDLIGQARMILAYAGQVEGKGRTDDDLAYHRDARQFRNVLLAEQPNGDFAVTMTRQFFISVYNFYLYEALKKSNDKTIAAFAEKSLKEVAYHVRHSSDWMLRLGDGTEESHSRTQNAVDDLWIFIDDLFQMNEVDELLIKEGIAADLNMIREKWKTHVEDILKKATLAIPQINNFMRTGSREGKHTEHLGYILAEMQFLPRAYPDAKW
ncbi:MAG TPA: 1,2-phenylacetyl-CoA epoxidase subunit PaaC [Bacteroidia bacterium]|nr:1,2-phenylacetyl-CoA epoxidase subunit PaaC [Bacteroidia bacterium]